MDVVLRPHPNIHRSPVKRVPLPTSEGNAEAIRKIRITKEEIFGIGSRIPRFHLMKLKPVFSVSKKGRLNTLLKTARTPKLSKCLGFCACLFSFVTFLQHILHANNATTSIGTVMHQSVPREQNVHMQKERFFKTPAHVVQMGSNAYVQRYAGWSRRNREWAACMGYSYELVSLDDDTLSRKNDAVCALTAKVGFFWDKIHHVNVGDWLVYLDLDVQFAAKHCEELEDLLLSKCSKTSLSKNCSFVALSTEHTINTGILIVRVTESTRELVNEWLQRQLTRPICVGPGDQMALQSAVLKRISPKEDGEEKVCVPSGRTLELRETNLCFRDRMAHLGYPEGHRKFDDICLLSCNDGLQCHDCSYGKCSSGSVFWHDKKTSLTLSSPTRNDIW